MTEKEYNEREGIRRSALWKLTKSPMHFKYELEHPSEPSASLILGQAVHAALLSQDDFMDQYAVALFDGRTKDGKTERAEAAEKGITLLTREQADTIRGILASVNENAAAKHLLTGLHEQSYFWTDEMTGELCKCRTDCEVDIGGGHYIVDLKTCRDASTDGFMRDAMKYGYHVQAAMYTEGVKKATGQDSLFVFVCVETEPPYAINILQADDAFMTMGKDDFRYLLGLYHECNVRDEWPGYNGLSGAINVLELPKWMKKEVE